jgi:hypothetical protein
MTLRQRIDDKTQPLNNIQYSYLIHEQIRTDGVSMETAIANMAKPEYTLALKLGLMSNLTKRRKSEKAKRRFEETLTPEELEIWRRNESELTVRKVLPGAMKVARRYVTENIPQPEKRAKALKKLTKMERNTEDENTEDEKDDE